MGLSAFHAKRLPTFFVCHETFPRKVQAKFAYYAREPRNRHLKKGVKWRFSRFSHGILRSLLFISKLNGFSTKSLPTFFVKREKIPRMIRVKFASEVQGLRNLHFKKVPDKKSAISPRCR